VLTDSRKFLLEFRRSPRSIGAIVPSSSALARTIIAPVDFEKASVIIEFGPGTGVMTEAISRKLFQHNRYVGIEINKAFCKLLTARFPHLSFINSSAEHIGEILDSQNIAKADAIVCGIPWASLPSQLQSDILDSTSAALHPGGVFITFAYVQGLFLPGARALRRALKARFTTVKTTRIVWLNLPPAFAYVCYK
jgi:phospholipid N-methyltransferase